MNFKTKAAAGATQRQTSSINKQSSISSTTSNSYSTQNSLDSPTVFTAKLPGLNATITASSSVENNLSSSSSSSNHNNKQHATPTKTTLTKTATSTEKRDKRLDEITSSREELIAQRQRAANENKARTLAMYDSMAKSGNAGDTRTFDLATYTGKASANKPLSGSVFQKRDLVEETIRARAKACDDNKKRVLAAYDYAAKTQPAGTVRDVDMSAFKGADVSNFEIEKPCGAATFQMSGGVPNVVRASPSVPSTPNVDGKAPNFAAAASSSGDANIDAYERSLRQRKQDADERKRRTLAAYKAIAASGEAGPKLVVQEELEHFEIPDDLPKPKFSCTTSFSGGAARI